MPLSVGIAGASEYHWMAGNFLKYGGRWRDMPVDAHELIALCATRPVFPKFAQRYLRVPSR